jgi:hypothetical protein
MIFLFLSLFFCFNLLKAQSESYLGVPSQGDETQRLVAGPSSSVGVFDATSEGDRALLITPTNEAELLNGYSKAISTLQDTGGLERTALDSGAFLSVPKTSDIIEPGLSKLFSNFVSKCTLQAGVSFYIVENSHPDDDLTKSHMSVNRGVYVYLAQEILNNNDALKERFAIDEDTPVDSVLSISLGQDDLAKIQNQFDKLSDNNKSLISSMSKFALGAENKEAEFLFILQSVAVANWQKQRCQAGTKDGEVKIQIDETQSLYGNVFALTQEIASKVPGIAGNVATINSVANAVVNMTSHSIKAGGLETNDKEVATRRVYVTLDMGKNKGVAPVDPLQPKDKFIKESSETPLNSFAGRVTIQSFINNGTINVFETDEQTIEAYQEALSAFVEVSENNQEVINKIGDTLFTDTRAAIKSLSNLLTDSEMSLAMQAYTIIDSVIGTLFSSADEKAALLATIDNDVLNRIAGDLGSISNQDDLVITCTEIIDLLQKEASNRGTLMPVSGVNVVDGIVGGDVSMNMRGTGVLMNTAPSAPSTVVMGQTTNRTTSPLTSPESSQKYEADYKEALAAVEQATASDNTIAPTADNEVIMSAESNATIRNTIAASMCVKGNKISLEEGPSANDALTAANEVCKVISASVREAFKSRVAFVESEGRVNGNFLYKQDQQIDVKFLAVAPGQQAYQVVEDAANGRVTPAAVEGSVTTSPACSKAVYDNGKVTIYMAISPMLLKAMEETERYQEALQSHIGHEITSLVEQEYYRSIGRTGVSSLNSYFLQLAKFQTAEGKNPFRKSNEPLSEEEAAAMAASHDYSALGLIELPALLTAIKEVFNTEAGGYTKLRETFKDLGALFIQEFSFAASTDAAAYEVYVETERQYCKLLGTSDSHKEDVVGFLHAIRDLAQKRGQSLAKIGEEELFKECGKEVVGTGLFLLSA